MGWWDDQPLTTHDSRLTTHDSRLTTGKLQGSLGDEEALGAPPPREGLLELPLAAGAVALIPGTWEFFIALSDHLEWSDSHTVVGEVHSLSAIDMIAMQPYEEVTHPEHGTVMRMMRREAPFTLAPAAREDLF